MRLALNQKEAAAALGLSVNHFKEHVRPDLKVLIVGGLVRFPTSELERYVDRKTT